MSDADTSAKIKRIVANVFAKFDWQQATEAKQQEALRVLLDAVQNSSISGCSENHA
jgi:hypothetical protein